MIKKILPIALFMSGSIIYADQEKIDHLEKSHAKHWGYNGDVSPEHWGDMDPNYATCKNGVNQSPINLTNFIESELPEINFSYHLASSEIINNGHTVQVNIKEGSSISIDNKVFELKQFHFHSPSENNINGKTFPLEAHFVHASKDGKLAVIAVMFKEGEENQALKELWAKMPQKIGDNHKVEAKNLLSLLPKDRDYYRFNGSLTTPPCTEGVRWMVLKQNITLSKNQINLFKSVMHHDNNRPIQSTNARAIMK